MEPTSDIAVIGYAARVPGAVNAAKFWDNLCHGVESIRTFSVKQLESVGVSKTLLQDPDYVRVGAALTDLDAFDAGFFGISPQDAAIMDPQQRLFMENAWEAMEHAGYAPGTFQGSTGVFTGSGPNSYLIYNLLSDPELVEREGIFLLRHTGNDKDVLATRLSYQMNLRGPSVNVQTTCSTSLVAVHLACESLLHFTCDMALAGAVSIELPHAIGYQYRQNEIQARDGHCRAFDADATGSVFGSGMGAVILRRLSDAIAAGDTIHAVIKGSAVNNDGSRKVGFFAPSVEGQVEVILEALGAADVDPSSIDYIETHGTGTAIGDPIEMAALSRVFAGRERPLKIGAVKTNIGHLDTAAGLAGLLKTVMALRRRKIPATLHFKKLNPLVDASKLQFQVIDRLTEWESADGPRRAGVTALGIGGTNAHVILEEPPEPAPTQPGRPVRLFTLSAKTPAALDDATRNLASHLRQFPDENLDDTAYTLHVGRSEFAHRRMFVARDYSEALQRAEQPGPTSVATGKISDLQSVAFLFSGQGPQHCDMGRELYQTEPVFRKWIDACAALAQPHLGFDFREMLYPAEAAAAESAKQIKQTWNAQPILFAVEYALAQLWISWGIRPAKLIGHSLGEYPAACLSGVFTLEDAISIVCVRGALMKKVSEGAMLAVSLSEADAARWITGSLSLATVNAPEQCVISGPTAEVLALKEKLKEQEIASHRLETSHAFHSSLLDPVLDFFVQQVREKQLRAPQIPIVSNVTGSWLTEKEATDPAYWGRHFREAVRFSEGMKTLQADPVGFLLEMGPGDVLCGLARQNAPKEKRPKIFQSLPRSGDKDLSAMLAALGHLWVDGVPVDWKAFHANERLRRIPLPTYPFQRKRFWMGPKIGANWITDENSAALAEVEDPAVNRFQSLSHVETAPLVPASSISAAPVASPGKTEAAPGSATTGSDEIESVLEQLWQRLLGLAEIDSNTDFFDSGGHSLLAVRLFTEIRRRFNVDFPLSTLFEARTVGALAELIRKTRGADSSQKNAASSHALVAIRPHGANTPLFLIHSLGGNVLNFEYLARCFPDDQTIYAIESRGLSGFPPDYSVEAMARHYIQRIRERQPHGPYFVAGHSFGGLVTYEIARQLTAQNETMGLVGLLDTYQRNLTEEDALLQQPGPPIPEKARIFQRLGVDLKALIQARNRLGYLQEAKNFMHEWIVKKITRKLYRSSYMVSSRFGWAMPAFLHNVVEANSIAADYYTPGTYKGTVVFFRCERRLDIDPPDSSRIWKRLITGEVVILEVPGDHNSMLREPNAQILAKQILNYLKPENTTRVALPAHK